MCGICAGVYRCAEVCVGEHECVQVCSDVWGYAWVCKGMCRCIWDEFSEYLMETRVLTSADFHTYPIRIFFLSNQPIMQLINEFLPII